MIRTLCMGALALVLCAPAALAQQATAGKAPVNESVFAAAATSGGLAEVSLSELGVQRATDADLKKFSRQALDDRNRMNRQLATPAARKGLAVPRTIDTRAQFCAASLAGLSGKDFD